ncbi:MAG: hypothetical protein NC319_10035, partial [Butyricicoccus sp.]|nr:hypothetical protein [Butyricicoccus sp.]
MKAKLHLPAIFFTVIILWTPRGASGAIFEKAPSRFPLCGPENAERNIVVAKSAQLRFRLTAKTAF